MMHAKEGSSLYYSLLYCTDAQRRAVLQSLDLISAMGNSLMDVSEPDVAEKKIHWWHEEIDRLHAGTARHPAGIATQKYFANSDNARTWCLDILSVTASERYASATDDAIAVERLQRDYGARLGLIASVLCDANSDVPETAITYNSLAAGLGMVDRLRRLPHLIHRGYDVFSDERYMAHALSATELNAPVAQKQSTTVTDKVSAGLNARTIENNANIDVQATARIAFQMAAVDEALEHLNNAFTQAPITDKVTARQLLPIVTMAGLRRKQLQLWQKKQPDLLRESEVLTPIRKFALAWFYRRRFG